jgi:hypothetical protein
MEQSTTWRPLRPVRVAPRGFFGSLAITWLLTLALCGCWGFWVYKAMPKMERVVAALPVPKCECPPCAACPICPQARAGDCPPCQCTCNCGK